MILKRERNLEKNFDRQESRKIPIRFLSRKLGKCRRISRHGMSIRRVIHLWKILFPLPLSYAPLGARKVAKERISI